VLPFSVMLFEVQDCQTWKDHLDNCASYHFLMWMAKMNHPWWLSLHDFFGMLCEQSTRVVIMLVCNQCSKGCHMGCFPLSLEEMLIKKWLLPMVHMIVLNAYSCN